MPVGYIGLIGDAKNEVTICVSPEYNKMGFGSFMLKEFIGLHKKNIWSKVKLNNLPSSKLFINNGFKKFKKYKGLIYYIYKYNE
jgi:ribosomal protein S18 acetylase RimI-like enzyme